MTKLPANNFFCISIIAAMAALAMISSIYNGIPGGNDLPQHYQFASTIYHSILSGEIYPSWANLPNQGYGDIGLRFYPPFAYYVLSLARMVAGNWFDASLLTFFLIFWIGGIGAYFWAKEEFSVNQSLLAAGIYIFAPYHVNQIYNNFLYAEFAASAVLPFCFLFISRVCKKGNYGSTLGLAVSFGLLLVTHLPSSIIGSLTFLIYSVCLVRRKTAFKTLTKLITAVFCGLIASSFYWLRMVTEMSWVKHSSETYFQNQFDYHENFLLFPVHLLNYENDILSLWLADLMNLAIILIAIPSIVLLFRKRHLVSKFFFSAALVFIFSVIMTTPLSRPIWDNVNFLQKVQFPWRWLGVASLSGAIFSSSGVYRAAELINQNKSRFITFGLGAVLIFFTFVTAFVIKQAFYSSRESFNEQIANVSGGNSFDCWWTIWAAPSALDVKEKVTIENRQAEVRQWASTERAFSVSAGQSSSVRIASFYYPYWQAKVNGHLAEVAKTSDGVILIALPPEECFVQLSFTEPRFVKIAFVLSAMMWTVFLLSGFTFFLRENTALLQGRSLCQR